jgi:purine-cytosine permease-like protein
MKLLDFVGLYGTILMPMGAIVFVDFYLLEKIGLAQNYAERRGLKFNLAAGLAWVLTLYVCAAMNYFLKIEVYFLAIPGWFIAGALYLALAKLLHRPNLNSRA